MTDQVLNIRLRADGSGLVGELRLSEREARKLSEGLKGTGSEAERAGDKGERGMRRVNQSSAQASDTVNRLRGRVVAAAAAFASFEVARRTLVGAVNQAAAFETAMLEVSTLLDDTSSIDSMSASVRELTATYGGRAPDQAKALYDIISSGAKEGAEAIGLLTAANKLALGGVTDVNTAADGLTTILNAWSLEADQATSVSDALFVAMRGGKTTIEQLSSSIFQAAPIAAQLGVEYDELLASVSALTTTGTPTAQAMTQVRAALAAVAGPSEQAKKLAADLGIEFNATAIRAQGLAGFLESVTEATGGSEEQLNRLFGSIEATQGVMALTGSAAGAFAETLGDMGDRAGTTEQAVAKMNESTEQALKRLSGSFSNIMIELGNRLLPAVATGANWLAENLDAVLAVTTTLAGATVTYLAVVKGLPIAYSLATASLSIFNRQMLVGVAATNAATAASLRKAGALRVLGGVITAAFTGWQIGSFLRDQFLEVELAGNALVELLLVGWARLRQGASIAWEGIKAAAIGALNIIRARVADLIDFWVSAASRIPTFGIGAGVIDELKDLSSAMRPAESATERLAARVKVLNQEFDDEVDHIRDVMVELGVYAITQNAAKESSNDLAGAGQELADIQSELEKEFERLTASLDTQTEAVEATTASWLDWVGAQADAAQQAAITQRTLNDTEAALRAELAALQGGPEALREWQREQFVLNQLQRLGIDDSDALTEAHWRQIESIRELSGAIFDARQGPGASGIGRGRFGFEGALENAVDNAFSSRNLSGFFNDLSSGISSAWAEGGARERAGLIDDMMGALGDPSGVLRQALGPFAAVFDVLRDPRQLGINQLFGGRLFGSSYESTGSGMQFGVGPGGASGVAQDFQERQRSFFRGTRRRTVESDLDPQTQRQIDALFDSVEEAMGRAARQLGARVPDMIAGEFSQEFDADGNLVSSLSTVMGRVYEESIEEFAARLQAENVLAVIGQQFDGIGNIAERWRADAMALADGTQMLASASADLRAGRGLFDELAQTADVVEQLSFAGETLAETYQRLVASTESFENALGMLGLQADGTREQLVTFAADIAEAAGGVQRAQQLWSRFFDTFFDDAERLQARIDLASARADGMLGGIGLDADTTAEQFRAAFEQALQGGLSAEAIAEWLQAGEALADVLDLQSEVNQLREREADLLRQYADAANGIAEEVALANLSDYQRAIAEIELTRQESIATLNATARAAGLQASREEDLAAVHERAAIAAARAMAQLEQSARQLVSQLGLDPLSQIEAQIAEMEDTSRGAADQIARASGSLRQASTELASFADSLLIGDLSPLNTAEQLAEAMRQLRQASAAGDQQAVQQLSQTALRLGRDQWASGQQFVDLFGDIQGIVRGTRAADSSAGQGTQNVGEQVSSSLRALYTERDRLQAERDERERFTTANVVAQQLADLAFGRGESFADIAEFLDFDLEDLAADLRMDVDTLEDFLTGLQTDGAEVAQAIGAGSQAIVDAIHGLGGRLTDDRGRPDRSDFTVPLPPVPERDEPLPVPPPPDFGPRDPRLPGSPDGPPVRIEQQAEVIRGLADTSTAVRQMQEQVADLLSQIAASTSSQAGAITDLARSIESDAGRPRSNMTGGFV